MNDIADALRAVAAEMGLPDVKVERYPVTPSTGPRHLELDVSRAHAKLGWEPRRTPRDGLREYLRMIGS